MEKTLLYQYQLIKDSRRIVFDFCESLKQDDLVKEVENFGRGSIRNLLVHIENAYDFWLKDFVFQKKFLYTQADEIKNANEIKKIFEKTDLMVVEFLETFRDKYDIPLKNILNNREVTVSPLKIFTHLITHEFHHKGQVLSMGRHLGYTPIETGIIY
jgi:uncharacterized damage-inducible protein DinB